MGPPSSALLFPLLLPPPPPLYPHPPPRPLPHHFQPLACCASSRPESPPLPQAATYSLSRSSLGSLKIFSSFQRLPSWRPDQLGGKTLQTLSFLLGGKFAKEGRLQGFSFIFQLISPGFCASQAFSSSTQRWKKVSHEQSKPTLSPS